MVDSLRRRYWKRWYLLKLMEKNSNYTEWFWKPPKALDTLNKSKDKSISHSKSLLIFIVA